MKHLLLLFAVVAYTVWLTVFWGAMTRDERAVFSVVWVYEVIAACYLSMRASNDG